jgi:hypothetical protein
MRSNLCVLVILFQQVLRCCKAVLLWFAAVDSALQDDDDMAPLRYIHTLYTIHYTLYSIRYTVYTAAYCMQHVHYTCCTLIHADKL